MNAKGGQVGTGFRPYYYQTLSGGLLCPLLLSASPVPCCCFALLLQFPAARKQRALRLLTNKLRSQEWPGYLFTLFRTPLSPAQSRSSPNKNSQTAQFMF